MKYYGNDPLIEGSLSHTLKPIRGESKPFARVEPIHAPKLRIRGGPGRPIKRTSDTGEVKYFSSATQAAQYMNKNVSNIRQSLKIGIKGFGYKWEYLTKDEIKQFDNER